MSAQISIRGQTYAQVKKHCEENGLRISEFVAGLCERFLASAATGPVKPAKVATKAATAATGKAKPAPGTGDEAERRPPDLSKTKF